MAKHEFWLTNDFGTRTLNMGKWLRNITTTRVVNGIGTFAASLQPRFPIKYLKPDNMFQFWRAPDGRATKLWSPYLVRKWSFATVAGMSVDTLDGLCPNDLLRRRVVAATAGSAAADKTGPADDMLKEIMREALEDDGYPEPDAGTREWSNFRVLADTGDAPSITKAFSFDQLLYYSGGGLFPAIARQSRKLGTPLFFEVFPILANEHQIKFALRTSVNQLNIDRTSAGVLFSLNKGNLKDPTLIFDYGNEATYIYAGGQGHAMQRMYMQASDPGRYLRSQWGRIERFADARNQALENSVLAAAEAELDAGRPLVRFSAQLLDKKHQAKFQKDWDFGDKVQVEYKGHIFDGWVAAARIDIDRGRERVQSRFDFVGFID